MRDRRSSKLIEKEQSYKRQKSQRNARWDRTPSCTNLTTDELRFKTPMQQLIALMLLTYICMDYLPTAYASPKVDKSTKKNDKLDNEKLTYELINATCSEPAFATANKPNMRFDFFNGQTVPASCIKNFQEATPLNKACLDDITTFNSFFKNNTVAHPKIQAERLQVTYTVELE